jgi:hypothetical protein
MPGAIQVMQRTYQSLRERYELHPRGTIEVKGKGPMAPYLLAGRRSVPQSTALTANQSRELAPHPLSRQTPHEWKRFDRFAARDPPGYPGPLGA